MPVCIGIARVSLISLLDHETLSLKLPTAVIGGVYSLSPEATSVLSLAALENARVRVRINSEVIVMPSLTTHG